MQPAPVAPSRVASELSQWINRVTESEIAPAKQRYVVKILTSVWQVKTSRFFWDCLNERPLALDAHVCLKAMILLHRMIIDGPREVIIEFQSHISLLTNLHDVWALTATKDPLHDLLISYIAFVISHIKLRQIEPGLLGNFFLDLHGPVAPNLVQKLHVHLSSGLTIPQKMLSERLFKIRSVIVSALVLFSKENHAIVCLVHHLLSADHLNIADRNQQTHQYELLYSETYKFLENVRTSVPVETTSHMPQLPRDKPLFGDLTSLPFPETHLPEGNLPPPPPPNGNSRGNGEMPPGEMLRWVPHSDPKLRRDESLELVKEEQRPQRRSSNIAPHTILADMMGPQQRVNRLSESADGPLMRPRNTMAAMGNNRGPPQLSSTEQHLSQEQQSRFAPPRAVPKAQPPSKSLQNFIPVKNYLMVEMSEIQLGDRIGIGSFAEVFKGSWRGTQVAVKKLLTQNMTEDAHREYQAEVEVMQRLRHPNIVLFMGSISQPDCLGIIMEYMQKGTLFELLHETNMELDVKQMLKFACDAARGMTYLHMFNPPIIHRDLKSLNLMLDANYNVKVTDFGLSKAKSTQNRPMTARCGTYQWMAPELVQGHHYTEKIDIFSFGIVLWEMMSRQPPYLGMPDIQVGMGVVKGLRPTIPKDCPPAIAKLMQDCWHSNPDARPTALQVLQQLEALLESMP